jgi:ubiquinone/menaquinone biosynthesis C-methylase UbiE
MKINHVSFPNGFYEIFMKLLNLFRVEDVKNVLELNKDDVVLDCGAGSGYYARNLQNDVKRIYALDSSEDFERKVKETEKITVMKKECPPIPFNDNYFDKIYITDVLHHIEKDKQDGLLKEFYRILSINGLLGILEFDTQNSYFGKIIYKFEKIIGFPCTFYQPEKLNTVLEDIGFSVDIIKINNYMYIAKCRKL